MAKFTKVVEDTDNYIKCGDDILVYYDCDSQHIVNDDELFDIAQYLYPGKTLEISDINGELEYLVQSGHSELYFGSLNSCKDWLKLCIIYNIYKESDHDFSIIGIKDIRDRIGITIPLNLFATNFDGFVEIIESEAAKYPDYNFKQYNYNCDIKIALK
jgi:hypothetical protein